VVKRRRGAANDVNPVDFPVFVRINSAIIAVITVLGTIPIAIAVFVIDILGVIG